MVYVNNGNISIVQIEEKMFHYNIDDIKNLYSNYKIKQKDVKISHSVNIYKQKREIGIASLFNERLVLFGILAV